MGKLQKTVASGDCLQNLKTQKKSFYNLYIFHFTDILVHYTLITHLAKVKSYYLRYRRKTYFFFFLIHALPTLGKSTLETKSIFKIREKSYFELKYSLLSSD